MATKVVSFIRWMYKVPFFNPLMLPVNTKFLVGFFGVQAAKISIENKAMSELRMVFKFGAIILKKSPI
jgi:hypothetical protein